jgi:hypothetical protein
MAIKQVKRAIKSMLIRIAWKIFAGISEFAIILHNKLEAQSFY